MVKREVYKLKPMTEGKFDRKVLVKRLYGLFCVCWILYRLLISIDCK